MLDHPFVRLSLKLFQIIPLIAGWIKKRPPLLKLVANSFFRYGGVSWILSQKWVKSSYMLQTAEILERLQKGSHPRVYVNACTHGNERVGARILESLQTISLLKGTLVTNIAHKEAFALGKRYIDQDLNRVFPGKPDGDTEERLAHELLPLIQAADIVLDIHSTESGRHESLIVTKIDESTQNMLDFVNPKRVLIMSISGNHALISSAKIGIAFEYGSDQSESTYQETLRGIMSILIGLGMVKGRLRRKRRISEYYEVSQTLEKPVGFAIEKTIQNFKFVQKGGIVARSGEHILTAPQDFYPILFGKNTYTSIFGFMGVKVPRNDIVSE